MRRFLVQTLLPLLFCTVPLLAGILIVASLPAQARKFYFENWSPLDKLIAGLGLTLFFIQTLLCWQALHWAGSDFNRRPDRWLTHMAHGAEWFPLLGLIGTVASIMQTFAEFGRTSRVVTQTEIIYSYAPAITATCTGLVMALVNILPTWVVLVGRDLIRNMSGDAPAPVPVAQPAAEVRQAPAADSKVVSRPTAGRTSRA